MNVSVEGGRILLDDQPARLFGFRVGSAPLRDDWTAELIDQLPLWQENGVNCLALWLQGTSGGFVRLFRPGLARISDTPEPIRVRANYGGTEVAAECGATSGSQVVDRSLGIAAAAGARGMAVIAGIVYRYTVQPGDSRELIAERMAAAAAALRGCPNVILNVWNEPRIEEPLENPESLLAYLEAAREAAPGRPVGTGYTNAGDNIALARSPTLSLLLHDAGRTLEEAVEAYRILRESGKPVVNVESFGGRGNGYADVPHAEAEEAPAGCRLRFAAWTRVYGVWRQRDYVDGNGRLCIGSKSYRELIRHAAADRERRSHLMIHVGGWFQGASRVERQEQIGRRDGFWTNTFHPGVRGSDGTIRKPGIGWLIEEIAAGSAG